MKKGYTYIWIFTLVIALTAFGCKKKVKPLSERIAKAWIAETVNHNSTMVYTRGGSANTWPGYSDFRLNLTSASGSNKVSYTEWNGDKFEGDWELQGDSKLILKNLMPPPTASSGTIEFNITSIDDNKLVLTRTTASKKTGDTINSYTLTFQ